MSNPAASPLVKTAITIVGTGPAGMFAALKLANNFDEIVLIGSDANLTDYRTTALMMPVIKQLDQIGVWGSLLHDSSPLKTMQIIDQTKRIIRSPSVTFHSSEIGESEFGFNIPNTKLNGLLHNAIISCPKIKKIDSQVMHYQHNADNVIITLDNKSIVETKLLVAADGRHSLARSAANIETRNWSYPQTALVLSFSHTLPHQNRSTEFHTCEGPFTQVPLPGNRSSLVWVNKTEHAEQLLKLTVDELAEAIEEKMISMLGKVKIETPVQSWPMTGTVPKYFARNRTILIGEAAHVFPPIGAQGLNLGIRDVVDLINATQKSKQDPGSIKVISDYNRHRKPDVWARTGFVHFLNRTLLSEVLPAQLLRSGGLGLLRQFSPLRKIFMHEAMEPGTGISSIKRYFSFKKN